MREPIRYYAHGSGLRRKWNPLTPEEKAALHGLQKGRCYLCGDPFQGRSDYRLTATEDHVKPVARGGTDYQNRLLAHRSCNMDKGKRKPYPCETLYCEAIWTRIDEDPPEPRRKLLPCPQV